MFNSLSDAAISVRAIAQGASERNISVVVEGAVSAKALRAVHAAFYLSPNTVSIGLIGPGTVGRVLLAQMATQIERLRALNLDLRVRGIAASNRMLLEEGAVDLARWRERLKEAGEPLDLQKFINHVQPDYMPHTVVIDCTASADIAAQYRDWLARGIHLVTPNKKANSGSMPYYRYAGSEAHRWIALFVRSHGRRRLAGDSDAAGPARNGRRDQRYRRHLLRYPGLPLQCLRWQRSLLLDRQYGQGEGLHRTGPAR